MCSLWGRRFRLPSLVVLLPILVTAQDDSQAWLNRGMVAFKNARYQQAIEAFQKSVDLNPNSVDAHFELGKVHMRLWIPGAESLEGLAQARAAEAEFRRVRELDPTNPQVYYSLGVAEWAQWSPALMTARARHGMRPSDPGPLSNPATRQDLTTKYGQLIDDAIANFTKALDLDPTYADAMAYMSLLIRERADLRDTRSEYRDDISVANRWLQKTPVIPMQKSGAQTNVSDVPPLPPPPPPPAQRVHVDGNVQQPSLSSKVDPVCPSQAVEARISGVVRVSITIGMDGHPQTIKVIDGHPMLMSPVLEAVRQWVYRPTLVNGTPVEVITEVDINMACGGH